MERHHRVVLHSNACGKTPPQPARLLEMLRGQRRRRLDVTLSEDESAFQASHVDAAQRRRCAPNYV